MTSPDTLKALAAELREIDGQRELIHLMSWADIGQCCAKAAAILESIASADEGVPVVGFLMAGGCFWHPSVAHDGRESAQRNGYSFDELVRKKRPPRRPIRSIHSGG